MSQRQRRSLRKLEQSRSIMSKPKGTETPSVTVNSTSEQTTVNVYCDGCKKHNHDHHDDHDDHGHHKTCSSCPVYDDLGYPHWPWGGPYAYGPIGGYAYVKPPVQICEPVHTSRGPATICSTSPYANPGFYSNGPVYYNSGY